MIIHRVSYRTNDYAHAGFTFHKNRQLAEYAASYYTESHNHQTPPPPEPDLDIISTSTSKNDIIAMLNAYAGHPNNG